MKPTKQKPYVIALKDFYPPFVSEALEVAKRTETNNGGQFFQCSFEDEYPELHDEFSQPKYDEYAEVVIMLEPSKSLSMKWYDIDCPRYQVDTISVIYTEIKFPQ